jgi:flavin reductase (DIM6/NTAB) family NADH-FMN oxidoreductase RutF
MQMQDLEIKNALSNLTKPELIVMVTTFDVENNRYNTMPAAWHMRTSFDPPLIAVSIGRTRHTHTLIKRQKEFVVTVCGEGMERDVEYCGSVSGRNVAKFENMNSTTKLAKKTKSLLINEGRANFECKVVGAYDTGDHTIFVGEVIAAYASDTKPLLHVGYDKGKRVYSAF